MPRAALKKEKAAKPVDYIVIDYPKQGEVIHAKHYTVRVGTTPCQKVEISIDDQPWHPCRHAVGFWWYDWTGYAPGNHQVVARMFKNTTVLVSKRRRCKIV